MDAEVDRARRELEAALEREAALRDELDAADSARRGAAQRAREAEERLRALEGRRSVRAALAAASMARPLFRALRGSGTHEPATVEPSPPTSAPSAPPTPTAPPMPTAPRPPERSADAADAGTAPLVPLETLEALAALEPVTIVVPVHDAAEAVLRCLESVLAHTTSPARLLIVDDASTDPGLREHLDAVAAGHEHVDLLRNERNLGYTASINRAIAASTGDVVLLNSDTVVGPRWLEHLVLAAYRDPRIATATAMTDNQGAFSVPELAARNPLPDGFEAADAARLVAQASGRTYPATPTANGFCTLIKRAVLDTVRGFDEQAFPRGYGEENDFSLRASAQGWRHVVDDATFVLHERGASTGADRDALMERGRATVDARHPHYTRLVREFVESEAMAGVRERLRTVWSTERRPPQRILYVHQEGTGGVPATTMDLAGTLDHDRFEPLLLTSNAKHLKLSRLTDGDWEVVGQHDLRIPLRFTEVSRDEYRRFVADALVRWEVELVHLRHLLKHTLDLPGITQPLGIPLVLSLHDHYLVCPTVNLIDHEGVFCHGRCTPGQGTCEVPIDWLATAPHLKHGWVHTWRERVADHVAPHVDAVVSTSSELIELHQTWLPGLSRIPSCVIEHGRDLDLVPLDVTPPADGEPIRVLVLGNLGPHKGADVLREVRDLDVEGRIELHLLGRVDPEYRELGTVHGPYARHELRDRVAAIAPHVVALLSTTAESWSHTLTEAWALGLPVVVSDRGALRERVARHGGGWVVDVSDARGVLEVLRRSAEPQRHRSATREARRVPHREAGAMAREYSNLYAACAVGRRLGANAA